MKFKNCLIFFLFLGVLSTNGRAHASVIINEILADPPAGVFGDANGDEIQSSTQDEFVELLNLDNKEINLKNWSINDAVKKRHVFTEGTILPAFGYLVVFGGGNPNLSGINWQIASTGSLGLNDTGDTVFLYDANEGVINMETYKSKNDIGQSLARYPEGTGIDFVPHSNVSELLYSPGKPLGGELIFNTVVPEPKIIYYFLFGGLIVYTFAARKTAPFGARMNNGRSVFRFEKPRALARGTSFKSY